MKPSNIGGQAVMEGIMMRHKDKYSIAVRRPDKEIEVKITNVSLARQRSGASPLSAEWSASSILW